MDATKVAVAASTVQQGNDITIDVAARFLVNDKETQDNGTWGSNLRLLDE